MTSEPHPSLSVPPFPPLDPALDPALDPGPNPPAQTALYREPVPSEPTWGETVGANAMTWFRNNSPAAEPSRWLAGVGALLLLVAGIFVTIARWKSITPPLRLGGLVLVHSTVLVLGERLRHRLPDVGRALAHLGAGLFAATGIQAVSTLGGAAGYAPIGGRWPLCCLVGGIAASVVLEVQRERWSAGYMRAEQVLAVALGGAGFAALASVPVGVVAAVLAAAAFSFRRSHEATAFGLVALATPVLGTLADDHWGSGTARDLGSVGSALAWAAPTAGIVGAVVVWLIARERSARDSRLGTTLRAFAAGGLVFNLVIGYARSGLQLGIAAFAWLVLGGLVATALALKSDKLSILSAALFPAVTAIQLWQLDATRSSYLGVFVGLCGIGIAAIATTTASAVPRVVARLGQALTYSSAFGLTYTADAFDAPTDVRVLGVTLALGGIATGLRGLLESNRNLKVWGAGVIALGVLAEVSTIPTSHPFDIWIPLAIVLSAVGEGLLRKFGTVSGRYAFATPSIITSLYVLSGQAIIGTDNRAMMAIGSAIALVVIGATAARNAVAVVGVITLLGSLTLALGPSLATMPLWAQFASGGVVLFGLAAVIERRRMHTKK
jgi:hypothetical protein